MFTPQTPLERSGTRQSSLPAQMNQVSYFALPVNLKSIFEMEFLYQKLCKTLLEATKVPQDLPSPFRKKMPTGTLLSPSPPLLSLKNGWSHSCLLVPIFHGLIRPLLLSK